MKDEGALSKNKESLLAILTNLGFVQGSSWNNKAAPAEILLMGGLDEHIKERIGSLKQVASSLQTANKPVAVCYLTGPRGSFPFEKSLAKVLALEWFEDASLESLIQPVLSANEKNGWTNDVLKDRTPQIKLLLLAATGKINQQEANALVIFVAHWIRWFQENTTHEGCEYEAVVDLTTSFPADIITRLSLTC